MNRARYTRTLVAVFGAHALLVAGLIVAPLLPGCASKPPDLALPVKLIIEIPPSEAGVTAPLPEPAVQAPAPEPVPEPAPVVMKEEKKKTPPKEVKNPAPPKREPKKIEVSKTLVRRKLPPPTTQRKSALTPEEIARLLERGATPGKRASLSDSELKKLLATDTHFSSQGAEISRDQLNLEMIRQTMYRAWDQPAQLSDQGLTTTVELHFQPDGTITSTRIVRPSGNRVMDESVLRAVQSVHRIPGLSPGFLDARRTVTIGFQLTEDG